MSRQESLEIGHTVCYGAPEEETWEKEATS